MANPVVAKFLGSAFHQDSDLPFCQMLGQFLRQIDVDIAIGLLIVAVRR